MPPIKKTVNGQTILDCVTPYQWTTNCIKRYPSEWHTEFFCVCGASTDNREFGFSDDLKLYKWFDKHKACYPVEQTTGEGLDR